MIYGRYRRHTRFSLGRLILPILGKYNEGIFSRRRWIESSLLLLMKCKIYLGGAIGIGGKDGNSVRRMRNGFITDYDCYIDGIYDMLSEYEGALTN